MQVCRQVLADVISLEGVPTWVTRVANNVRLSTTSSSYVYASPTAYLCTERQFTVDLIRQSMSLP
jgi:hypothetical protein